MMKYQSPRIVQPGWRTLTVWILIATLLAVAAALAWSRFGFGLQPDGRDLSRMRTRMEEQSERIELLEAERGNLREQLATLERAAQIDREAMLQVQEELETRIDERITMQEELTFLRSIVASGLEKEGLYIQGFKLEATGSPGLFNYRFTVSQALKDAGTVTGWIHIKLDGELNGEKITLSLQQVTADQSEKLKMRFRHYQDVSGSIQLPEGFEPRNVVVQIKPGNKKLHEIEKRFDWLLAG